MRKEGGGIYDFILTFYYQYYNVIANMNGDQNIENKPYFDLERAKTMINKRVLIGLTYYDHKGIFLEQKQMHGIITSVDEHQGFGIALEGSRKGEI